ncbi:MAG: hypothetical protein N3F65_05025 [Nitrososphaeria archaeon]|nr:hypothetical protein [Aigarchaeota archaeon]MCX8187953.1 hypothetical protein [Nitrososphaeria archaeon]
MIETLEELHFIAIAAAFAVTTAVFLKLYLKVSAEIKRPLKIGANLDEDSLNKLREILSQKRETDLRELLNELREIKSKIEMIIRDEGRGDIKGEGGSDNRGVKGD